MRERVNRLARPVATRLPISARKAAWNLAESGARILAIRGAMLSTSLRGVIACLLYGGGGGRRQRRLVAEGRPACDCPLALLSRGVYTKPTRGPGWEHGRSP